MNFVQFPWIINGLWLPILDAVAAFRNDLQLISNMAMNKIDNHKKPRPFSLLGTTVYLLVILMHAAHRDITLESPTKAPDHCTNKISLYEHSSGTCANADSFILPANWPESNKRAWLYVFITIQTENIHCVLHSFASHRPPEDNWVVTRDGDVHFREYIRRQVGAYTLVQNGMTSIAWLRTMDWMGATGQRQAREYAFISLVVTTNRQAAAFRFVCHCTSNSNHIW